MAVVRVIVVTFVVYCLVLFHPEAANADGVSGLRVGFYDQSCPQAENIIADIFAKAHQTNPKLPAWIIRLLFHDCFVNGCDASLLLDSNPSGDGVEKNAGANFQSIRGVEIIDDIKTALEEQCPGIVSCADTLAFAAREAMAVAGVPRTAFLAGRRDGVKSVVKDIAANVPAPTWTMNKILKRFGKNGFNAEEMVVLTGAAHSVGQASCAVFSERLGNAEPEDSVVDLNFLDTLKHTCPRPDDFVRLRGTSVDLDPEANYLINNNFFTNLLEGRGVLTSDVKMAEDPRTRTFVEKFARDKDSFLEEFTRAMMKLSTVGVITGNDGEIRKVCRCLYIRLMAMNPGTSRIRKNCSNAI